MNNNPYNHMDKDAHRVAYLIAGYIRNTLSNVEHEELDDWVNASDANMKLFEDLTDERNIEANLQMMDKAQSEQVFKELQQQGRFEKPKVGRRINMVWMSAAMAIILLGVFFLWRSTNTSSSQNTTPSIAHNNMLQPGGNKATLTLSNGSIIDLTGLQNGALLNNEGQNITKENDNTLVYQPQKGANEEDMHTLTVPTGGQFQLILPDNTKVWLNAESVLRYPATFSGSERNVELIGEAYFEVSPNANAPFNIMIGNTDTVSVLGTHFNVQAYPSDKERAVTLVEGKVLVHNADNKKILKPGMQAVLQGRNMTTVADADIEAITGWKNGLFVFHDEAIEKIMNQVARWYNAKVVFEGEIRHQFNATINRSEPLEKLLHLLQLNGYVKFKTENNIIYVYP